MLFDFLKGRVFKSSFVDPSADHVLLPFGVGFRSTLDDLGLAFMNWI